MRGHRFHPRNRLCVLPVRVARVWPLILWINVIRKYVVVLQHSVRHAQFPFMLGIRWCMPAALAALENAYGTQITTKSTVLILFNLTTTIHSRCVWR